MVIPKAGDVVVYLESNRIIGICKISQERSLLKRPFFFLLQDFGRGNCAKGDEVLNHVISPTIRFHEERVESILNGVIHVPLFSVLHWIDTSIATSRTRRIGFFPTRHDLRGCVFTWRNHHSQRTDRKSTRLNSSHIQKSRMPSSA